MFEDIITKDVFKRYNIRHKNTATELYRYLVENFSERFTFSRLSKVFNLHEKTIEDYISYISESFLGFSLSIYSTKNVVRSAKKFYIIDNSFHYCLFHKRNIGKLMENLVFIHLIKKYKLNEELFYYITPQGYEIDFLIKEKNRKFTLIQVTRINSLEELNSRDIRALANASERIDKKLTIITWHLLFHFFSSCCSKSS